ncbi:MAG: peptidoglycan-binding protein [Acidobacteriia bacterium]|nr:peptidoglycan-binding protein [Terriglobia bacterium]
MNFRRHKTGGLLVVLLTGACLSAPSLHAAQASTPETARKPLPQKSAAATHRTTTTPAAKNPVTRTTAATTVKNPATLATGATATQKASTVRRSKARSRRRRPLSGRQRLARLHLEPGRVQEIQQALIREGYLQGDPNARWDDHTRAAMLRYQKEHGFPATGLPEAKSLMKLGLGPHPLPAELDPDLARASAPNTAKGDPAAEPTTPTAFREATPPQEK